MPEYKPLKTFKRPRTSLHYLQYKDKFIHSELQLKSSNLIKRMSEFEILNSKWYGKLMNYP